MYIYIPCIEPKNKNMKSHPMYQLVHYKFVAVLIMQICRTVGKGLGTTGILSVETV